MSAKISLILNSYNPSRYLQTAITSILNQTYCDFELLIWDDGSTDDSLEIARSLAASDERVRVVAAPHQGRGRALRDAIEATEGQYLAWIDRDDVLAPTALERTAAILDDNPEIGVVYTDYLDIDADGNILGLGDRCQIPYSRDRLLTDFISFHFRLLRREVYDRVGGIDPAFEYAEDYDLCLRLSEMTEIHHLSEPLYHYRHHAENTSRSQLTLQTARSQCAVNNALRRRNLQDTLQLQVRNGMFILRPRPTASRSRVAAVLASLSLPLLPLPAAANPVPLEGTAIIETASQGVAQSTPTPSTPDFHWDSPQSDGITKAELDAELDALQAQGDLPEVYNEERIGQGYGYGGNGYGYNNRFRFNPPMRPESGTVRYHIAPDGNIQWGK